MTDKAIYMNNFPHPIHGSLQPLRLGGESNLKEGETMSDAWDRMHKEAVEWHRIRFGTVGSFDPSTVETKGLQVNPAYTTTIDYKKVEYLEDAISACTTTEQLDQLKAANPLFPARLLESFNRKRKELTV